MQEGGGKRGPRIQEEKEEIVGICSVSGRDPKPACRGNRSLCYRQGIKEGEEEANAREEGRQRGPEDATERHLLRLRTRWPPSSFLSTEAARRVTAESRPVTAGRRRRFYTRRFGDPRKPPRVPTPAAGCGCCCCCCCCRRRRPQQANQAAVLEDEQPHHADRQPQGAHDEHQLGVINALGPGQAQHGLHEDGEAKRGEEDGVAERAHHPARAP